MYDCFSYLWHLEMTWSCVVGRRWSMGRRWSHCRRLVATAWRRCS